MDRRLDIAPAMIHRTRTSEIRLGTFDYTRVAVRTYRDNIPQAQALWQATVQQLDAIQRFKHPNIVQTLGLVDNAHVVLEYLPHSLFEILTTLKLTLDAFQVAHIVCNILLAVYSVHQSGERIGNLTSAKVMLSGNQVKILGVGRLKIYQTAGFETETTDESDVHSIGILIHEMAVEKHQVLDQIVNECLDPIPAKRPNIETLLIRLMRFRNSLANPQSFIGVLERHRIEAEVKELRVDGTQKLKSKLKLSQRRLTAVESQLVVEVRENDEINAKSQQLGDRIDQLQEELDQMRLIKEKMEQKVVEKENQVMEWKKRVEMVQEMNKRAGEMSLAREKQNKTISKELRQLNEQIERMKRKNLAVEEEKKQLEIVKVHLETEIQEIKASSEKEREKSLELEIRWDQSLIRLQTITRERDIAQKKIEKYIREKKVMLDEIKALDPENGSVAINRRAHFDETIRRYEEKLARLTMQHETLAAQHSQAQLTLAHQERQIKQSNTLLQTLEEKYNQQTLDLEVSRHNFESLDSELQETRIELQQSEIAVATQQEELKKIETAYLKEKHKREEIEFSKANRSCMTEDCDAPSFLVTDSGYCENCVANQARLARESAEKEAKERIPEIVVAKAFENQRPEEIVEAMQKFQNDKDVLLLFFQELRQKARDNDRIKQDFACFDGIRTMLELFDIYLKDAKFLIKLLQTIEFLVFNDDQNRCLFVTSGILRRLTSAFQHYSAERHPKMMQRICTTLTNLAHNSALNRKRIIEAGLLQKILDTMQACLEDPDIQYRACWALLTLAGDDDMCLAIASEGGVGAVLAAMLNCAESPEVQYYGSWALVNLLTGQDQIQKFGKNEGAIEVCQAAIACFPDHEGIQEKAGYVLSLLIG